MDCELTSEGLVGVTIREADEFTHSNTASAVGGQERIKYAVTTIDEDNAGHLRIGAHQDKNTAGIWFASALAAYAGSGEQFAWYVIPEDIAKFAIRRTVPCGILVMLGLVEDSEVPEWAAMTEDTIAGADVSSHANDHLLLSARNETMKEKRQREHEQWEREAREVLQKQQQDISTRKQRALQSTPWDNEQISQVCLNWLAVNAPACVGSASKIDKIESVSMILLRMIQDVTFSRELCRVLELWKAWSDNGGIKQSDFDTLTTSVVMFAQASLLVAVIREAAMGPMSSLSADLHACIEAYKMVRLG